MYKVPLANTFSLSKINNLTIKSQIRNFKNIFYLKNYKYLFIYIYFLLQYNKFVSYL